MTAAFDPALIAAAFTLALILGLAAAPLGRRLAGCGGAGRRGWRGLLGPAATLAMAGHASVSLPAAQLLPAVALAAVLVAITAADLETMLIPDVLSLPLIPAGLLLAALWSPAYLSWTHTLSLHAAAAAAGYLLVWGLSALWLRVRGMDGMGLGDAKLLAAAGAWVGPAGLPGVLLYGSVAGLLTVLALSALKRAPLSGTAAIPFGPFLALGFWLVVTHGPPGL